MLWRLATDMRLLLAGGSLFFHLEQKSNSYDYPLAPTRLASGDYLYQIETVVCGACSYQIVIAQY